MKRVTLKLAIVAADLRNQDVAYRANALLDADQRLSELDISKLVTGRKYPGREQQQALAAVLGVSHSALFPDLDQEDKAS